jgi:hypothetical protein
MPSAAMCVSVTNEPVAVDQRDGPFGEPLPSEPWQPVQVAACDRIANGSGMIVRPIGKAIGALD